MGRRDLNSLEPVLFGGVGEGIAILDCHDVRSSMSQFLSVGATELELLVEADGEGVGSAI